MAHVTYKIIIIIYNLTLNLRWIFGHFIYTPHLYYALLGKSSPTNFPFLSVPDYLSLSLPPLSPPFSLFKSLSFYPPNLYVISLCSLPLSVYSPSPSIYVLSIACGNIFFLLFREIIWHSGWFKRITEKHQSKRTK